MSRCVERTKTAVALPHCCSESTEESTAGWCIFGSKVWLKLWKSDGMSYKKNTQVRRGASSRRFVQKIGEMTFFCGRCNTGGVGGLVV